MVPSYYLGWSQRAKFLPVVLGHEPNERPGVMDEGAAAGAEPGQEKDELLPPAKLPDLLEDQVVAHSCCGETAPPLLNLF